MHKYKLGLVILLVIVFSVPSQLIAVSDGDQTLRSPAIVARIHLCSITNVVDVQLQVTTILLNHYGVIQETSTVDILPGFTRIIYDTAPDLHLDRCTAEWFGQRDDIIGSICGIDKDLPQVESVPIGIACVPMQ